MMCPSCGVLETRGTHKLCYECNPAPHGEARKYSAGCRCSACRSAAHDQELLRASGQVNSSVQHGTPQRYRNGCRCDACTVASRKHRSLQPHNMAPEIYEELLGIQCGACPLCGVRPDEVSEAFLLLTKIVGFWSTSAIRQPISCSAVSSNSNLGASMAVYSGNSAVTETLTANTVDTVILTRASNKVTVTNVTGSSPIYFTVSHPGGSNPQPSVAGVNCQVLPAAIGSVDIMHDGQFGHVVNLISAGTPTYTVAVITNG